MQIIYLPVLTNKMHVNNNQNRAKYFTNCRTLPLRFTLHKTRIKNTRKEKYLSYGVPVIQWITSCHTLTLFKLTCNYTLARTRNDSDNVHVNSVFSYWNKVHLNAIKPIFKGHLKYDKQNFTPVVISCKIA